MPKRKPGKKGHAGKGPGSSDGVSGSECLRASVQKEQEWMIAHPESYDKKFFLDEMVNNADPAKRTVHIPADRLVALMKLMAGGAGPTGPTGPTGSKIRNTTPSPTTAIIPGGLDELHDDLRKAFPAVAHLFEVKYRCQGGAELVDSDLGRFEQEWFDTWKHEAEENEVKSHQETLEKAEQAWKAVRLMPHRKSDIRTSLGSVAQELGHEAAPTPCLQFDQDTSAVRLDLAAAADGAPSSYAWLFGEDTAEGSSSQRHEQPVGAKEPGVAGSENGGLSRRAFDEQPGKMHQEQETDDLHLFETWKDTIRRTCLHHDAYADAMVGMKETRQFHHKGGFQGGAQHFEAVLHEMRIVARLARNRVKLKIIGMNREAKLCKRDHDDSMPKLEKLRTAPVSVGAAKRLINPADERSLVESLFQNMTKYACKEPAKMAEKQLEGQLDELLHKIEKALTKTETSDARLLANDVIVAIDQHRALPDYFEYEKDKRNYHGSMLKTMLLVKGRVANALQARARSDPLLEALRCAVQHEICQQYQASQNDRERECNQRVYDELVAEETRNKEKAEAKRLKRKQKEEERLREKREADDRLKREQDRTKREQEQEQERAELVQRRADKEVLEEDDRREQERELARALADAHREEEENRELQEALMKVSMIELFDKVESTSAHANVLARETAAVPNPKQPSAWGSPSAQRDGPAGSSGSGAAVKPNKMWDTKRPKASKVTNPKAAAPSGKAPPTEFDYPRVEERPTESGPSVNKTFPSLQRPQATSWNWHGRAVNPGSVHTEVPATAEAPIAQCDAVDRALSCAAHILCRVQALEDGLIAGDSASHDANIMLTEAAADDSTIGHHTRGRAVIDGMLKDSGSALEQNPASITIVETLDLLLEHLALVSCPLQYDDTSDLAHLSIVHRIFGVVKVSWASASEVADAYCTFAIQATLPALWQSGITRPTGSGSSSKTSKALPVLQVRLPKVILASLPDMCEDEDIKALQGLVGRAPINVLQMLGATRFADKLSDPPASHTSDLYRLAAIVCTDGVDLRTIHLSSAHSTPDEFCEARTWTSSSSKLTKVRSSWRQISALVGVGSFRPVLLVLQQGS